MDAVERKVKQTLADAFARAYRPRLTRDPCEFCDGSGTIWFVDRKLGRDGEWIELYRHERSCPDCRGAGHL